MDEPPDERVTAAVLEAHWTAWLRGLPDDTNANDPEVRRVVLEVVTLRRRARGET